MYQRFFKRFFDIVIASVGLIVLSPLFLILWIWLSIANKGAGAFFVQERPGMERRYRRLCLKLVYFSAQYFS
ncbi:MAG: sugar transferase [Bacteroidales bacterium]|nr:sugar transferase [Bacteroidales bacterium]